MGRIFITFILTSAFWIWYYHDIAYNTTEEEVAIQQTEEKSQENASCVLSQDVTPAANSHKSKSPASTKANKEAVTTPAEATTQNNTQQTEKPATSSTQQSDKRDEADNTSVASKPISLNGKVNIPGNASKSSATTTAAPLSIVGKWQPMEGAEYPLEFTQYGAVIQTDKYGLLSRYAYATNGDQMKIQYDNAQFKLLSENNNIYLEIYNSKDFSGRYKLLSQPQKINATILPKENYSTLIVGKWTPVNGHIDNIEITKFGTVIQTDKYDLDSRYDYSLNGDKLVIKYDKNARIVISEDANYYYLEIYNTTDFSGRYRKKK